MRTMRAAAAILGVLLLLDAAGSHAGGVTPGLEARLAELDPAAEVSVIVRFGDRVDLAAFREGRRGPPGAGRASLNRELRATAERSRGPLERWLAARPSRGRVQLWAINGYAVTLAARHAARLSRLAGVESVGFDATFRAPPVGIGPPSSPAEWNLEAIRAPELWDVGCTGKGAVVASLDSGVDVLHPDLAGRWRGGANSWLDPYGVYEQPHDHSGHGTQVMGVLLGGDAGGTAIGVAPGARWIAARIFDDTNQATLSATHAAYQWLLDPDGDPETDDAPDVVNNSWGLPGTIGMCEGEFALDIAILKAAGIGVVFSAGNAGPGAATSASPANDPEALAVGALDPTTHVASFSGRGPSACDSTVYPRLTAPGVAVRAPDLTFVGLFPQSYVEATGTSVAAPHVTGAFALLKAAIPAASASEVEAALEDGAMDLGPAGADPDYGFGMLDVAEAHHLLRRRVGGIRTCGRGRGCGRGFGLALLLPALAWGRRSGGLAGRAGPRRTEAGGP